MNFILLCLDGKAGRVTPWAPSAKTVLACSLFLWLALGTTLSGADWRQFRGPHGNGGADETNVPTALNATNSMAWKSNLPGRGLSSPIIVGDRVFVTCSSGLNQQRLHVICLNAADGAKLWERQFWATGRTMCHEKTAVAAPTPASDGEHVVAIFSSNDIVCLDRDGNLIWFRGLGRDYPHASNSLGMTSSLLIAGGVVVAQVESQSEAFTAGLELATGVNRWRLPRARGPNWTSPVRLQTDGAELVALQSAKGIVAIEPATGRIAWSYTNKTSATPSSSLSGRMLLVPSQGLTALELGSEDAAPKQLWRSGQLNPGTPSPAIRGGKVFTLNDGGILTCGEIATGDRLWQLRLKGPFSASPVAAGQFLYCVNEKGLAQVVDTAKAEGEVVSELDLGETVLSTPAIAHGAIYFRSDGRLWKFGKS